jgi:uncharacterized cupin superfamily protein
MMTIALMENSALDLAGVQLTRSVVAGEADSGIARLLSTPTMELAVLQIAPGIARDTELDAYFIVLSGKATVVVKGGDGVMFLRQGVVGRLVKGSRTRWTITETLTLIFVLDAPPAKRLARSAGWSRIAV